MKKPITNEMLQAMSPDQLKTLRKNAQALDTPAAHEVLVLIEESGLLKASVASPVKPAAKRPAKRKATRDAGPVAKPIRASYGRQA